MTPNFDSVVRVVTACTVGEPPRVSAEFVGAEWKIRISNQVVVYKGATLDQACESLLSSWCSMALGRIKELDAMAAWLRETYEVRQG